MIVDDRPDTYYEDRLLGALTMLKGRSGDILKLVDLAKKHNAIKHGEEARVNSCAKQMSLAIKGIEAEVLMLQNKHHAFSIVALCTSLITFSNEIGKAINEELIKTRVITDISTKKARQSSIRAQQKIAIDNVVSEILNEKRRKGQKLTGSTNSIAIGILESVNRHLDSKNLPILKGASALRARVDIFRSENGLA